MIGGDAAAHIELTLRFIERVGFVSEYGLYSKLWGLEVHSLDQARRVRITGSRARLNQHRSARSVAGCQRRHRRLVLDTVVLRIIDQDAPHRQPGGRALVGIGGVGDVPVQADSADPKADALVLAERDV